MDVITDLPIASIQKRLTAFVIDDIVIVGLILAIFYTQLMEIASHLPEMITPESIELFKDEMHQFSVNNLLGIIALKIVYHTLFIWQNGMTLGKYFVKIKVIDMESNETPTLFQSLLRAGMRIVSEALFYLGFIFAFFSPLKQTLHDKISHCVVVNV